MIKKKKIVTSTLVDAFAEEYGIEEALLIQYFQYWIKENKKKGVAFRDGKWWTYGSTKKIANKFCYMNEAKIKKILKSLKLQGVIIATDIYNEREKDRTLWYTFVDSKRFLEDEDEDVDVG